MASAWNRVSFSGGSVRGGPQGLRLLTRFRRCLYYGLTLAIVPPDPQTELAVSSFLVVDELSLYNNKREFLYEFSVEYHSIATFYAY